MTARFASALLGALSMLGCADLLGLGGLTFEQEASGGAPAIGATSGAGGSTGGQASETGGTSVTLGAGGTNIIDEPPPPPPKYTDEYPVTWATGALVTSAWHGFGPDRLDDTGAFWVYDPATGNLANHRLELLEPDLLGSTVAAPARDLLYTPVLGGDPWIFAYDAPTGLVEYGLAPSGDESFDSTTEAGSPGWTHLFLAGPPSSPFLIAADRVAGLVRIGPADPNAEDPLVTSVIWETPFTDLLPFRHGDSDGVLRLDSALAEIAFVPIEDGELGEAVSLPLSLEAGWSLATTFGAWGRASLALYRASDGSIETYEPDTDGALVPKEQALWRRDLRAIVPVGVDGEPWAVAYDASTGIADVRLLDPLHPSIVVK